MQGAICPITGKIKNRIDYFGAREYGSAFGLIMQGHARNGCLDFRRPFGVIEQVQRKIHGCHGAGVAGGCPARSWSLRRRKAGSLETGPAGLLALTPDQRQQLTKMGDKSEAFCRKADAVFGENLAILPANFDLAAYRRDLATLDALRPRLARLSKLSQRGDDTQMAVGSDLMTNALEGYAVLKVTGKGQGVDELRRMLATRFARGPRPPSTPVTPAEPAAA